MALSRVLIALVLASGLVAAQGGGGSGAPSLGGFKVPTLFEVLSGKLGLDYKTQEPAVEKIFGDINAKATPIIPEIFQARQHMLSAEVLNRADSQKTAADEYTLAATKMLTVEVEAFKQVYAQLKPNQQKKAPDGFVIMAGMFLPVAAPRGGGAGRPGGGGGGFQGGGGGR
jgi:hypothetical protein